MDRKDFEPWRERLAQAFDAHPEIQITKFSIDLNVNKDYISRLIRRGTASPSPSLLIEICEKIGVSPAYIISGEKPSETKEQVIKRILESDEKTFGRIQQLLDLLDQG